jgi:protein arginine N-methyltransferase 1
MSSISEHAARLRDRARVEAYGQALVRLVKPGAIVADIGSGPGLCALIACRCGARRVYAIEPDPVAELAIEIAADNHCADRVHVIRERSTLVTLPERADVIVTDVRGVLPDRQLPALLDARRRFLAPGGVMVPLRDDLYIAPVDAAREYGTFVDPWDRNPWDLDLGPARTRVLNTWIRARIGPDRIMADPARVIGIDYMSIETRDLAGVSRQIIRRHGTVHGMCVWFTRTLADGITFSNVPDAAPLFHGSAFFPLQRPIAVEPEDILEVRLTGVSRDDGYAWSWATTLRGRDGRCVKASFDQSTADGEPEPAVGPPLIRTDQVHVDSFILDQMTRGVTVEEIARRARAQFPRLLASDRVALGRVGRLAQRYG